MRFLLVLGVIAVVCLGAMYEFNPKQFNVILAKVGVTSWQAPEVTSAADNKTSNTAVATTTTPSVKIMTGGAAAATSASTPMVDTKTN